LENLRILAVVVAELKLGHVQRKIFSTDLVIGTHNAALEQRPKTFDGVGMNRAHHVLPCGVVDNTVRVIHTQRRIATVRVGAEQTDFVGYSGTDKVGQSFTAGLLDHASNDVAFALHGADDNGFASPARAASGTRTAGATTLVLMPILGFAAHVGLVDFDDAHELLEIFVSHTGTDAMAHAPCGAVGAETEQAMNLQGADAFLADEHQVDHLEPLAQTFVGVLEDRPDSYRKAVVRGIARAVIAKPVIRHRAVRLYTEAAALRAAHTGRPAARYKVRLASVVVGEHLLELAQRKLMDGLMLLLRGHDLSPEREASFS